MSFKHRIVLPNINFKIQLAVEFYEQYDNLVFRCIFMYQRQAEKLIIFTHVRSLMR